MEPRHASLAAAMIFGRSARHSHEMLAPRRSTIAFAITRPLARGDLPGLCGRVCGLLDETRPEVAFCDVSGIEADAVTVDALAHLQVAARRHGCQVRLRNASAELLELVEFMGLRDVLPG